MVRVIDPVSDIKFTCFSQSFMRTPGEIVSLVFTNEGDVRIICYNQAEDTVTTIHNCGGVYDDSNSDY